jgi:hypothetical protein
LAHPKTPSCSDSGQPNRMNGPVSRSSFGNYLQCFHAFSTRKLSIWLFIVFVTLYPVPWLHSWSVPFSISLMKYSLLYFFPWGQ